LGSDSGGGSLLGLPSVGKAVREMPPLSPLPPFSAAPRREREQKHAIRAAAHCEVVITRANERAICPHIKVPANEGLFIIGENTSHRIILSPVLSERGEGGGGGGGKGGHLGREGRTQRSPKKKWRASLSALLNLTGVSSRMLASRRVFVHRTILPLSAERRAHIHVLLWPNTTSGSLFLFLSLSLKTSLQVSTTQVAASGHKRALQPSIFTPLSIVAPCCCCCCCCCCVASHTVS